MSIAEKLIRAKTDLDDVYEAGKQAEYDRFWDSFQNYGQKTNGDYMFVGLGWAKSTLRPKYKMKPTTALYIFWHCGRRSIEEPIDFSEIADKFDFSLLSSATYMFSNANMINITVDFSNVTTMAYCFYNGYNTPMNGITITVSDKCTDYTNAFTYLMYMTELRFTEGSVIAASISVPNSPLTKASIESVVAALSPTVTGQTATFKKTAKEAAFTADEWAALIATKSNWTFSLV